MRVERCKGSASCRFLFRIYLLTLFFIGLGYLAILPVFEGFDENAHYSSLRQIADTGIIPLYGASYLDRQVVDYAGPVAYGSLTPPFDRGMGYSKFFTDSGLAERYLQEYRQPVPRPTYRPSQELNWQAQHPPLYYFLLAPIVHLSDHFSFVAQIFLLRLVSFMLALAGVFFGLLAARQTDAIQNNDVAIIGFMFYPVMLPMFFPEFTRIGNDSLCLFLVGVVTLLLSLWLEDQRNTKLSVAIGVALGLGLLTKAFFLPITAALAIFLSVRSWQHEREIFSAYWLNLLRIFLPALLIGGGWYVYKFLAYGIFTGSDDAIRLAYHGGLIANLKENFSLYALMRGIVVTVVSWSWAGTWSLTRLPALFHMPLLLLTGWIVGAYVLQLRRRSLADPAWLPVWLFGFFGCGLFYHVVISVALNGNGNTPGWYLHVLMPWAAPAFGMGIRSILRHRRAGLILIVLLLYAALFQMIALWAQFALFTGCATKGDDKYYVFSGHAFCLDRIPLLIHRMTILGWPHIAMLGFGAGLICILWLVMQVQKNTSDSIRAR